MSAIPSLKNLCIYNSLGKEYLSQSLDYQLSQVIPEKINPNFRILPDDLKTEIRPIEEDFQKCMGSQRGFFQTIEKNPELALFLIKKDSRLNIHHLDIYAVDNGGHTVLHCAAASGNRGFVEYLVGRGANVNAVDRDGQTVLHFAARSGNKELVEYLVREHRANVNAVNNYGETILHAASSSGNKVLVEYLISHEANVNAVNNNERTVLHAAALGGNRGLVEYLVGGGANVNAVNNNERTVLHAAALGGNRELVEYLVGCGANVNAVNNEGETVLHLAAQKINTELVEYLTSTIRKRRYFKACKIGLLALSGAVAAVGCAYLISKKW
jgi:ankyrin repeat protein